MKTKELRNLTRDELTQKLMDKNRELFNLRMQRGSTQVEKTHLFKQIRRTIARIKTLLTEKKLSEVSA
ncbi:MAG: 50S ribosomal protein L29 [Gammaproteobacteria bacterium]